MKRPAIRGALALLLTVLLCAGANIAAFFIDTQTMRSNAAQGVAMLGEQGGIPQLIGGFKAAQLDNYTSVLILKTAAYTGEETLMQRAFGGTRTDMPTAEGQSAWEAYCTYADGSLSPTGGLTYSRYWHGYTLPLRILLCVMNVSNTQMFLLAVQLCLLVLVLLLLQRRRLWALFPGFLAAYLVMMPPALGICLQYAPVSLIMLTACALLLALDAQIGRAIGMPTFFALTGILTNYFDLLTFPLAAFGFPLVILIALRLCEGVPGGKLTRETVLCSLAWGLGYGGMWALKWGINALVFSPDLLRGVHDQIALRLSSVSGENQLSRLGVLLSNLDIVLAKPAFLLILAIAGVASLALALNRARHCGLRPDARALLLLLPIAAPVVWTLLMANHSFDHTYYTYRNLACALFAGLALVALWPRAAHPGRDSKSPVT